MRKTPTPRHATPRHTCTGARACKQQHNKRTFTAFSSVAVRRSSASSTSLLSQISGTAPGCADRLLVRRRLLEQQQRVLLDLELLHLVPQREQLAPARRHRHRELDRRVQDRVRGVQDGGAGPHQIGVAAAAAAAAVPAFTTTDVQLYCRIDERRLP